MDGGDEMIHGLSEEEKFKVIRPMLGEHMLGDYGMPIIHKTDEEMLDIENMEPVGIKNLTTKQDNSKKIVLPFTYECFFLGIHTARKVCGGYQPATAGF